MLEILNLIKPFLTPVVLIIALAGTYCLGRYMRSKTDHKEWEKERRELLERQKEVRDSANYEIVRLKAENAIIGERLDSVSKEVDTIRQQRLIREEELRAEITRIKNLNEKSSSEVESTIRNTLLGDRDFVD